MGDVICPICHDKSGQFDDYGKRKRVLCHHCHSLERTRAMADMWTRYIGGAFGLRGKKGLIVSPSSSERMFFRNQGLSDITTLDIRAEVEPDIQGDLCEADFLPDDTYHFIYASYVFPFLHDYQKALWHIRRVLKTDGIFVNFVPVHNRRPTIHHQVGAENSGWYGKENFEKYNIGEYTTFGDLGVIEDHARFFIVKTLYGRDIVSGKDFCFLCCYPKEAARMIRAD